MKLLSFLILSALTVSPVFGEATTSAFQSDDVLKYSDASKVEKKQDVPLTEEVIEPFGLNLFQGNFSAEREEGMNPDYVVAAGDKVSVQTWGSIEIDNVFTVDGQGNIFLPDVGPVHLSGVANKDLTKVMRGSIGKVYKDKFDVYTNLLSTKPVAVYVAGLVNKPGRYAGVPSDGLLYFMDRAGGISTEMGSYRRVKVLRGGQIIAENDLYDFILRGHIHAPQFTDGDTILVEKRGPVITLKGDIAQPAQIEFKTETFFGRDALDVIPEASTATEITLSGMRQGMPFNQTMNLHTFRNFKMENGDVVTVRNDGKADTIVVKFEGEFEGAGELTVKRGARLQDVLNFVKVKPELANVDAVHVRRKSLAIEQKEALNASLFRLERSALLAQSDTKGEVEIRVREAELIKAFVDRASQIQPLGRIVTTQNGDVSNILLEPNDVIVIPTKTNVVQVGGEVFMAQALVHKDGMTAEDYIMRAGGFAERADQDHLIILRANGEAIMGRNTTILAGDQILVPPTIDSKNMQAVMDVTQILYQIAVSAGVLIRPFV